MEKWKEENNTTNPMSNLIRLSTSHLVKILEEKNNELSCIETHISQIENELFYRKNPESRPK